MRSSKLFQLGKHRVILGLGSQWGGLPCARLNQFQTAPVEEPLLGMPEPLRLDGGASVNIYLRRGQSILGCRECIRTVLCINYDALKVLSTFLSG